MEVLRIVRTTVDKGIQKIGRSRFHPYLIGMATLMDFSGALSRTHQEYSPNEQGGFEADRRALAQDWNAIAQDLDHVMGREILKQYSPDITSDNRKPL